MAFLLDKLTNKKKLNSDSNGRYDTFNTINPLNTLKPLISLNRISNASE